MTKFNMKEKTGFLSSLAYLGDVAENQVLTALDSIECKNLT